MPSSGYKTVPRPVAPLSVAMPPGLVGFALTTLFLNFSIRMKSPGFVDPGNPTRSRGEATQVLKKAAQNLEDRVMNTDLTLTCTDIELPVFGCLTRYEWIKFISVHIQRHVHQLKAILPSVLTYF
ncbi:MAG: hypothetical protein P4L51_08370 [Puia sp.]|nr:hypothetical protein [Puia sp.]